MDFSITMLDQNETYFLNGYHSYFADLPLERAFKMNSLRSSFA